MRTRNIFRYLLAIIIALGTTANAMAQQRNLKIYFNQYTGATDNNGNLIPPILLVTDDNSAYDIPAGVTVTAEGVSWAKDARFFEWINQDVNDRLLADYVRDENGNYYTDNKGNIYKKESHMKLNFTNFPYEVNMIQWNKMNDLLSGSVTDFFKNYGITTTCVPASGNGFSYSEEHWAMNIFTHNATFSRTNIPWKKENNNNVVLNGLTSFEINEAYDTKIGIGNWTWIDLGLSELSNKCRTFIKAGWNGQEGTASNIKDSDNSNWAFRVRFTLPDIRMRCYNIATGAVDNNIIVKEKGGTHKLKGYITAHAGAVVPTENPVNPEDFHFEYYANPDSMIIRKTSGVIEVVKLAGDVPVTVKLMRGEREVCSYTQTIHVYSVDPTRPQIAIGFRNGYKGYDVTVYGKNWIEGYIAKYGKDDNNNDIVITPTSDINDYHFEYSESSNGQIITINPLTGQITAKKEGDVEISAVLKNGTEIASNIYTYTLHVFAKKEGLTWSRPYTYTYSTNATYSVLGFPLPFDKNPESWKVTTTSGSASYDWKQPVINTADGQRIPYLNVCDSILENSSSPSGEGPDNWKQIAWFKTTSDKYWRAVSQKISFKMMVPKYSKADGTFAFAGNVTIGKTNKGNCNYGFEIKDLGVGESSTSITKITWNTTSSGENVSSSSGNYTTTTLARKGVDNFNNGYVGDGMSNFTWSYDNSKADTSADQTRYLAVMAYLYRDYSYPGEFSVGYKGIPTYTYYATITYYNNDGTGNVWETQTFTSTSKTETKQMYSGKHNLTRNGYELLGFSTNPEATTPEYKITIDKQNGLYIVEGDFCPYDAVNGGGKGPVSLYAVWNKIPDIVTLDPQGGTGGNTQTTAIYGQKLPNGLEAPTKEGYEFKGYYSSQNQEWAESIGQDYDGKQYYDKDMVGVADWDYTYSGVTLYAHWAPATFIVTFDGTNGAIVPKQMQYDNGNLPFSDVIYNSEGVVKISFTYGSQCPSQITNGKFKKAGFKLVGFYDSNNVLVATVDLDHPEDRNIYFNESSGYWTRKDGKFVWNCAHDVNLTARYEPKYTVRDGDIIDFGTEYLEVGIDWENSMVHDLLGAAEAEKEAGRISSTNPVMVFDIRNARYLDGSSKNSSNLMVPLRDKDFISPNLLVYLGEGAYNVIENEIETDGKCPGLVVTDRFPIKIPYAFNASKASYARDAKVADGDKGKDQAKNSYWGTLCLPYPIRNNANGVKFYEFQSTANNYFMFEEMSDNEVIPANTPVLYCRTDGGVGSMITIEEEEKDVNCNGKITKDEMVSVPANPNFTALVKSYANAHESIQDWEFRGNLKTNVFCGRGYINAPAEAIANSDITNNGEVYYFKQNKFTRLVPATTKNGTHYDAGKMTLYPYRAYFYKKGVNGSSAKVSAYSILVVDEFGNTTDITNAVFGDGEGDGKIYDLNGIRVMQPVKGRLYIVNGQKKVYR